MVEGSKVAKRPKENMAKRKASSRKRGGAPALDLKQHRQRIEQARQAVAEREAQMAEFERLVRRWEEQEPPDRLIKAWLDWCVANDIDPARRRKDLLRPLKDRLADLFYESPEGWVDDSEPPKDRILYPYLYRWGVFDDPERERLAAELVTYLEDKKEEWLFHLACRSTWHVAEWERAEGVVDALQAIIQEVELYIVKLHGDEPQIDPRIEAVRPLLCQVKQCLRHTMVDPPQPEPEGRAMVGPHKRWAGEVVREVLQRLEKIRPWRKYEDYCTEREHAKMLRELSEKVVQRLGIRGRRGFGSLKPQPPRPPSNPRHKIACRICTALGVQRLRQARSRF